MMGRATSYRLRVWRKRISVAYKVLRFGEFDLKPTGHVLTGTSGSLIGDTWSGNGCTRCGTSFRNAQKNPACPSYPRKVVIRP